MDEAIDLQLTEIETEMQEESDLNFAFRLQMEEAMVASLAGHRNPSKLPLSSVQELELPAEEDDGLLPLTLQESELKRLKENRSDLHYCRKEMQRISMEIRRQAHDGKFARDLAGIPDAEWADSGEFFERPLDKDFGEEEEPFKLYFKGLCELLSASFEEYVSAIGVSIYSPLGTEILRIQKPTVGPKVAGEVVDLMALNEGLNSALSLGITRLNIFVQHSALFKHITGRWIVKQRTVSEVIKETFNLMSKFKSTSSFFVPRQDVQVAFQLARETIDIYLSKTLGLTVNRPLKENCSICLEDVDPVNIFEVDNCRHRFCFSCMRQHVEVKLRDGCLPCCPSEGCKTRLTEPRSLTFLTTKLRQTLTQRLVEAAIPPTEKVYCPYPKCSALMARSEVGWPERGSSSSGPAREDPWMRQCRTCRGLFCLHCLVPWHRGMSCGQYGWVRHHSGEDAKLENLARQSMWRRCIRCNHMIELASGCFHVSCKCGFEFCFSCGAQWINKRATCYCPLWAERNIINEEDNGDEDEFEDHGF